jgi:transposase
MPAALSLDLRTRIIQAWQNEEGTWPELAERFGVGVATIDRLVARFRRTGSVEPTRQKYGSAPILGPVHCAMLREILDAQPDLTLPELVTELAARCGVTVSVSTMGRVVREELRYTRKKDPRRDGARPRVGNRRARVVSRGHSRRAAASPRLSR